MTLSYDSLTGLQDVAAAKRMSAAIDLIQDEPRTSRASNSDYYIENSVTGEKIYLCDLDDQPCNAELARKGFLMLVPDEWPQYQHPAIYQLTAAGGEESHHKAWDQSGRRAKQAKGPKRACEQNWTNAKIQTMWHR